MKPLACVKADFGAFNCMTLSKDQKLLAAGGQDDSITIVNLNNFSAFKLEIHKSFISQCRFFQPQNIKKLRREHLAKLEKMKKKKIEKPTDEYAEELVHGERKENNEKEQ